MPGSSIALDYTGTDIGMARLIVQLDEAGAGKVSAEPEPIGSNHVGARVYHGHVDGLSAAEALATVQAFLAANSGHQVALEGIEIPPKM